MAAKLKHSPQDGLVWPALLSVVQILTLGAMGLGCYLLWISVSGGTVAGCAPDSGCDKVLHSRWARWLGLPVSAIALLVYGGIFAGTLWLRRKVPPPQQRAAWRWLIVCAVCVLGAAVWFAVLQALVLKSFCRFCMAAHACGAIAAGLLLWCAPFRAAPEKPWQQEKQVFIPP